MRKQGRPPRRRSQAVTRRESMRLLQIAAPHFAMVSLLRPAFRAQTSRARHMRRRRRRRGVAADNFAFASRHGLRSRPDERKDYRALVGRFLDTAGVASVLLFA